MNVKQIMEGVIVKQDVSILKEVSIVNVILDIQEMDSIVKVRILERTHIRTQQPQKKKKRCR